MVLILTPEQVPKLWDHIKFAASNALRLSGEDSRAYFLKLLHELLSSKAQCFVRLNDERRLRSLAITKLVRDDYKNETNLLVEVLYSFEASSASSWIQDLELAKEFARKNKCKAITASTTNERLFKMLPEIGFNKLGEFFSLKI